MTSNEIRAQWEHVERTPLHTDVWEITRMLYEIAAQLAEHNELSRHKWSIAVKMSALSLESYGDTVGQKLLEKLGSIIKEM